MSGIIIENLTFEYIGSHETVFKEINLNLDSSWKLGLIGRNGKGKTTLLKLIHGELQPKRGRVKKR